MYYVTLKTKIKGQVSMSVKTTLLQTNETTPANDKFRVSILLTYNKEKTIKTTDGPQIVSDTYTIYKKVKIVRRSVLSEMLQQMTTHAIQYYHKLDKNNIVGFPADYLRFLKELDVDTVNTKSIAEKTDPDVENDYVPQ